MPARAKTLLAMLLCMFLCLFSGVAAAQAKQTVLLLSTLKANSDQNGENLAQNAFNRFKDLANVKDHRGKLAGGANVAEYQTDYNGLNPGDAVVVVLESTEKIHDDDLAAIQAMMAAQNKGIAVFIFADSRLQDEQRAGTTTESNIYKFVDAVNDIARWTAEVKFRYPDNIKAATDELADSTGDESYRTRYPANPPSNVGGALKNRYDFKLSSTAKYADIFKDIKVSYNSSTTFPTVEAISGRSHAAITSVPADFALYGDWDEQVVYEANGAVKDWYPDCRDNGCFEPGYDNRAYAVFFGHEDFDSACVFLSGDADMFKNFGRRDSNGNVVSQGGTLANFGESVAKTLLKVAASSACGCVTDASGACCAKANIIKDSLTGEEICADTCAAGCIANAGTDAAVCCHEEAGKVVAQLPDGSSQLCCPTENKGMSGNVATCCGEYNIDKTTGECCGDGPVGLNNQQQQVCCKPGEEVASVDGRCCPKENVSTAQTCCTNAAEDEAGNIICCDGENQAVAEVGGKKRCYDKSLVTSAGEFCPHGKEADKCVVLTSHTCPVPEEHEQQKVLFLSTDEWTAEESLVDICTSPTNRANEVDKTSGVAGCVDNGAGGVDCSKRDLCIEKCTAYVTSVQDKPKSEWTPQDQEKYNECRKVAFDTERVELEKRRGDFFVNNAYDAFKAVMVDPANNLIDRRGITGLGDGSKSLSQDGWVAANKSTLFDTLPKGSVVVIATEYRPMHTSNAEALQTIMQDRPDLTFVIFADGCRTCHRQFPSMADEVNAGAGDGGTDYPKDTNPQPAVLLPAEGDSNLQQFVNIINGLGTKLGTSIETRSRVGEIFGRKPSQENGVDVGVGNELRHYSFTLNETSNYNSLFAGLPAMFGYNPSAIVNLPAGYALYKDLTKGEIDIGKNLIKYQDCTQSTCSQTGDVWTGGYVSNLDYRKGLPKPFDYGSDGDNARAVAIFISHDDYNDKENPGSCVFLAGDLSFFDRHGEDDLSQIDHTKQHQRIAATLLNAALSDKCTRPPMTLTCETSGGCADKYTEYKEGSEDKCCKPEATVKDSAGALEKCCTETGITTQDGRDCCTPSKVAENAGTKTCCLDNETPLGDKGSQTCCLADVSARAKTCGDGETPDKVCCKYLCPGGSPQECKPGQIVDGDCGCKCNMPYEERPYCEDGQVPAPYISKSGSTGDTKAAVVACCRPRPTPGTGTPVPVNSPWALGLLGAAVAFAAARRRRQSKRRDDDA